MAGLAMKEILAAIEYVLAIEHVVEQVTGIHAVSEKLLVLAEVLCHIIVILCDIAQWMWWIAEWLVHCLVVMCIVEVVLRAIGHLVDLDRDIPVERWLFLAARSP